MNIILRFILLSTALPACLTVWGSPSIPDHAVEIGEHCWYSIISEENRTAVFEGVDNQWEDLDENGKNLVIPANVRFPDHGDTEYIVVEIADYACSMNIPKLPGFNKTDYDDTGDDICLVNSVSLPSTISKIGDDAFAGAGQGFREFRFPESVTEIGVRCFRWSPGLERVCLPKGLRQIPAQFASMCKYLKECAIPQEVEEIGEGAFFRCNSLERVYIPASVKEIGEDAFTALLSIENFEVDPANENFCAPDGILLDKEGKTLIAWPFKRTEVIVPEGVETLLGRPLSHAFELFETIDLPSSIKQLSNYSFESDTGIKKLTVRAEVPPVCEVDEQISIFAPEVYVNATLYVPAGSVEAYRAASVWKEFRNILAIGSDAVEAVEMDEASAEAEYFTLDGRKTGSPAEGEIVIRRQKGKSTAIIR